MRPGLLWALLATMTIFGCTMQKPLKDMVGYVPPTRLPAPAKKTLVGDRIDVVWEGLVDFLERSEFELTQADKSEHLLVARYSGDPEPYVDCGSIVTHERGTLSQIPGSARSAKLNYNLESEPVVLNRTLDLDSRIVIKLTDRPSGTVISTDSTYVVTKSVDIIDAAGNISEGSRETIDFPAGERGDFSKGTACQPNGFLDQAVLKAVPNIIGSDEIDHVELAENEVETAADERSTDVQEHAIVSPATDGDRNPGARGRNQNHLASPPSERTDTVTAPPAGVGQSGDDGEVDWVLPDAGLPSAALPHAATPADNVPTKPASEEGSSTIEVEWPAKVETTALDSQTSPAPERHEGARDEEPSSATIVDDTTRKLLETLDCTGAEWHFCELVEITSPYRKRNIERLFGLTVNTSESFADQKIGGDLKLDLLFPAFPSYLHVVYARRDGKVDHVMSSSDAWPADLSHSFQNSGQTIPGPVGLAMIVAIATDEPLLPAPAVRSEDAGTYVTRLKERLAGMDESGDGRIAASQLLIFVGNADT